MKKHLPFLLLLSFLCFQINGDAQQYKAKKDKRTPFPKVIYKHNHPFIEVDGTWAKLISIEGKPIAEYIKYAVDDDPTDWKRTFHRYLHYIMDDMGIKRAETLQVSFELNGESRVKSFPLKRKNRELATVFHDSIISSNRINRQRTINIPDRMRYLTNRLDGMQISNKSWLSKAQATQDLEYLEWEITHRFSYADLKGFDYRLGLDAIYSKLSTGISKRDFAYQLKMLMANFGDAHSRVSMREVIEKEELTWLPFRIIKQANHYYAVNPKDKTFFKRDYPQIIAINNIPLHKLYLLAKELVSKTTPKAIENDAVKYLGYTAFLLKLAGETDLSKVKITFSNKNKTVQQGFDLNRYPLQKIQERPRLKDSILNKNIGYISLRDEMYHSSGFIDSLHQAMQKVKNTEGLIIDIRGNGGGSRAPLVTLLPYFIKETKVTNVARYRIDQEDDLHPQYGYLTKRYLLPKNIDASFFEGVNSEEELLTFNQAVTAFKKNFKPSQIVSDNQFSAYHYMTVSPSQENSTYYYDKPVIVLIDEGCFSASDVFAAGIRQGDQVTLLGNITQGGSGYAKSRRLPNSKIKVRLSRMFSYQPDGNLYDGHGVTPDIQIDYTLQDKLGKTDSQLEAALEKFQGD